MFNICNELFLLMITLAQLKSEERIISVFISSINKIFPNLEIEYSLETAKDNYTSFKIFTGSDIFGRLLLKNSNNTDKTIKDILFNAAQLLAVILQKRKNEEILINEKSNLEQVAEERTREIRESEERYSTFINETSEGIYRMELDEPCSTKWPMRDQIEHLRKNLFLAEYNKSFARMYGFDDSEDMRGMRLADFHGDKNKNELADFISLNYFIEGAMTIEKDKYGKEVYFSNNTIGIIENDKLVRIWGTQINITDKIITSRRLKESEEKFRSLVNSMTDIVFTLDTDLRITGIYGQMKSSLKSVDRLYLNKTVFELSSKFDLTKLINYANKALKGNPVSFYSGVISNGEEKYFQTFLSPIRRGDQKITGMVGVSRDISEIKKAEKELQTYKAKLELLVDKRTNELRQSEERFKRIAEVSYDAIIRFDRDYRYLYVNPVVKKQLGKSSEELLGKKLNELGLEEEYISTFTKAMDDVRKTKSKQRIELKSSSNTWIDWLVFPEMYESGKIKTFLAFGRDITEIKKYEYNIKNSLEREKELNEIKSNFVSMASHEFRTPLSTVLASADLLELFGSKWDEEKNIAHIKKIQNSVASMTELLEDVLTLSRIEKGKINASPKEINFRDFISEIVEDMKKHPQFNHNFNVELAACNDVYKLDPKLVRQILTNILSNAIKYSAGKTDIDLKIDENKSGISFAVIDRGMGMSKSDLAKIYEPFFRSQNAAGIEGTGLGLSIVKNMVETLGGEMAIKSEPEKGTEVLIVLPITD